MTAKLIVVSGEEDLRANLKRHFLRLGMDVHTAACGTGAIAICGASPTDVVVLDVRRTGAGGLEAVGRIRSAAPGTSVVVLTAHGDARAAVEAVRQEADHLPVETLDLAALEALVRRVLESARRATELTYLKEKVALLEGLPEPARHRLPGALGATIEALAAGPATSVLIKGEAGAGKSVAARLLHERSPRASRPFVDVDCAALAPELVEPELFGYEKGAFPGAATFKRGLLELANGGTLFLAGVGALAPSAQSKLLKVLEDRRFRRLGGSSLLKIDTRILAASSVDLEPEVRAGRFRADLYYRLSVMSLVVPPLRQRRDEILPLAKDFLGTLRGAGAGEGIRGLTTEAEVALQAYAWPGNVRELRNVMERAALLAGGRERIGVELLPEAVVRSTPANALDAVRDLSIEALEREHIARVLSLCNHSRSQAARLLGIHRSTLLQKIARYGIVRPVG